ncbi:hypothetical protein IT412_04990 [Candidatus Peregrinibacteria bacterium]|nr:hypothetical protein [Candidatus Peregrinibacteria bacterium]
MANKYAYQSEQKYVEEMMMLKFKVVSKELCELYLAEGFEKMVEKLQIPLEWQKNMLFDFLMLEKKVVLECIRRNKGFFLRLISEGKGGKIRPMLRLESTKYDQLWYEVLDLLSLYFVQKKVDEKLDNINLNKFFENSILNEQKPQEEK